MGGAQLAAESAAATHVEAPLGVVFTEAGTGRFHPGFHTQRPAARAAGRLVFRANPLCHNATHSDNEFFPLRIAINGHEPEMNQGAPPGVGRWFRSYAHEEGHEIVQHYRTGT